MDDKYFKTFKKLGLSTYETLAYISLNTLISATAVQISERSSIPRSKIYDVLKKLAEKDFIEIERGRPLIYNVISPIEVLEKEKNSFIKELDDLSVELNKIYESKVSQVQPPIWRISAVEKIINKELEIIKRSKKSISMRIGFLFDGEGELLAKELKNKDSNVEINILASPYCYVDNKRIDIIKIFKKYDIPIVKKDLQFVKIIISDSKEMMHIYTKFSGDNKNVIPNSSIGVWNKYEDIAKNYDDRFKDQFRKIKSKSSNNKNIL